MKKPSLILSLFGTIVLAGCSGQTPSIDPWSLEPIPDSGVGYEKKTHFSFNLQDVNKSSDMHNLKSVGDSKLLIVPVQIKGEREWTSSMLSNLNKAFFGKAEETGWQSVSSFYKSSSYGKLNISGEVSPVFKSSKTRSQIAQEDWSLNQHMPDSIILDEFSSDSSFNNLRKQYDTDQDGFVDSVCFIYSNSVNSDDGYWAWVYWYSYVSNKELPNVNSYMWASYDFITDSRYAGYGKAIDSHTVIHESGHLLGLDDYYCYDEPGWDPSGTLEMHSNNIGDESIYSKFALGWVDPFYVKTEETTTLKLRSSSYFGDAILIQDDWNGTALDEYVLIEYYSPHQNNKKDSDAPYPENGKRMFTQSGFRIYHVDSRMVEVHPRTQTMIEYSDEIIQGKKYQVGASNSASYSYLKEHKNDFKLVHLMEAGGKNTFKQGKSATNATLFRKGDSFTANSNFFYNGSKFNDESLFGYKLEIGECTEYTGEITIKKMGL